MSDRLTLIQWLSASFPTGAFAYSHGLEQALADGVVQNAAGFADWLAGVLDQGAGWQDAVLLSLALRPGADHAALAALARALAPSAERLTETLDQGTAFARTVSALSGRAIAAAPLPVALGEAAAQLDIPAEEIIAQALHAFAANLCTVATRAIPLGQTQGQAVLAAQHGRITALAARAVTATEDDLGNAALCADLWALRHETLDVRIYRT